MQIGGRRKVCVWVEGEKFANGWKEKSLQMGGRRKVFKWVECEEFANKWKVVEGQPLNVSLCCGTGLQESKGELVICIDNVGENGTSCSYLMGRTYL